MKSYNMHTNSNKKYKRNKHRRHLLNTVSSDRLPLQIFNAHNRIENYESIERINRSNYRIVGSTNELKTNYSKDTSIVLSTQLTKELYPSAPTIVPHASPQINLCPEIMTLIPCNNENRQQNVNSQIIKNNSILLARLAMNALAASETDINAILGLVETMYNSIQEMLYEVKQKQQMYELSQCLEQRKHIQEPKYVIKIDLKRFIKYLNEQYIRNHSQIAPRDEKIHDITVPYWKQPKMSYSTNKCRSFTILLQPRRMSFNVSVCKFNSCSMNFFQRLAEFYNSCNITYNTTKIKPVPSVFIRDWHFRNFSQGYLLSVLLKHNNVMSLNVMRKFYFVIITSVTPNLTMEINFKLTNGIFMAYDTPPFEKLPLEVIHWNDRHRNVLESSSKILYSPAFAYYTPGRDDVLNNNIHRDTKSDNTLHNRSSSDSSSTLKYEFSSEYEGSDYFIKSASYSASGLLDLKSTESSTNLTLRESVKTLTLSIDDTFSYHVLLNRKDCGDMNFTNNIQEHFSLCRSTVQRSRTLMNRVFREFNKLKSKVVMPYINSILNETVFDGVTVSMEEYVSAFTEYWTSETFYKKVLKDLGSYFVRTLFMTVASY